MFALQDGGGVAHNGGGKAGDVFRGEVLPVVASVDGSTVCKDTNEIFNKSVVEEAVVRFGGVVF